MRQLSQLTGWLLTAVLVCPPALADFRGRPVSAVLDELRAQGLTFIYNTGSVPPGLQVLQEPRARNGVALAQEVLAAHSLGLSQVAPGVYAVVARPASPSADVTPPAPAESTVEEVVVQTSRYTLASQSITAPTFLTQQQVNSMPRLADETLQALQRLPGSASNGFSSLGAIRGGEPNETAIVLDGLRLYEPFHLKNFLIPVSLLDSRVVDGIDFYSGGFPARYGDRMSAIVKATSVRPAQPQYYELGLNLFHASGLAALQFDDGRGAVLLSGRRSNVGDLVQLSEREFGELHYSDGRGRIDYLLDDSTRASLDVLVSDDSINALEDGGAQRARARYRNVYTWATLEHEWSQDESSRLIASYTDLSNQRDGEVDEPGQRTGQVNDERLFHVIGLRLDNTFVTDTGFTEDGLQQRFGAEIRRLWGQYDYFSEMNIQPDFPFPGSPASLQARTATPQPEGYEASAYWDGRLDLGERWSIEAGLRVDTQTYDGSNDGAQWSPRLSALYELTPRTNLRASWGRFYQSQGINELQVEDGIDRFFPAQRADHAIVSLEHAFAAGLDLRIEAYRKSYSRPKPRFENMFDPLVLFPEAEFDRVMIAPDSARAEGVEVLLQLRPHGTRFGSWGGWLSYAWSRAEDRIDGRDVPRSWDQRHAVNLGVVWSRGPWTATLANSYHSGWPTTQLQVVTAPDGVPTIALDQRNRSRFAFYNSLDLRVTRTFVLPRGVLDVFFEASNATLRDNPCCAEYEVTRNPDGTLSYTRDVSSWLPLVPSVGVLWRY